MLRLDLQRILHPILQQGTVMTDATRRRFLRMAGVAVLAPLGRPPSLKHRTMNTLYIGTYTRDESEGIYRCVFDDETGALEVRGVTGLIENPSFLAAHPSGRYLYAVSETTEFEGQPGGGIYAYAVNREGRLAPLNRQPSQGGAPCYVSVTPDGNYVLVANYLGGNVALFPVEADGRLDEASDVAQHEGSGPNESRQEGPHAH
ncbi:MAG: beta-propeller fold lactonase family protein, partial [Rhodothermales bacterium]